MLGVMSDLTLTAMRVVDEVSARGSFTAAAGALGYTQSAVSRQVSLAEQAVGAKLFERGSRGVRPTQRGELLLRRVKTILAQVDAAMLEQDELGEPLSDRLTVGAFPTALAALVPRALARVIAEHPALEVKIREGGTEAQLRRLRAGRIDVGVIAAGAGLDYDLGDLTFDQLMRGQAHLIVSAEHRFAERGGSTSQTSRVNAGSLVRPTAAALSSAPGRRSQASLTSSTRCVTGPGGSGSLPPVSAWPLSRLCCCRRSLLASARSGSRIRSRFAARFSR